MPKRPQIVRDNIAKCRNAALAAVDAYNRTGPRFRTAHFLVMIVIAWSAAFHAIFYSRGERPWYRTRTSGSGTGVRYQKIDGEPKHWDLKECLKRYYDGQNPPERMNLEFLLGLRNKIEHRHLPELDATLYGECQAALLNLEELIAREFGPRHALQEQLAVSLQFSRTIPSEKKKAAKVLASESAKSVTDYVERFRGRLSSTILNSMRYSFSVFLVPKVANRKSAADACVEFIHVDEASEAEQSRLEKLNVLIREKKIPIANLELRKPSQVVEELREVIPFEVNMTVHTEAWRHFNIRPPGNSAQPERTQTDFCIYDEVHGDYVYTQAWINKLRDVLFTPEGFRKVTGREPIPKKRMSPNSSSRAND